jgi:DNA primase
VFHCFGCHKGGSLTTFLTLLNIPEADIKDLVSKSNFVYKAPIDKPKFTKPTVANNQLIDESVLAYFQYKPQQLIELGYPESLLWAYRIGFHIERNRIIYPLRDEHGRLVGVSGGSVIGMKPKYKVYTGCYEVNGYKATSDYGKWFDELYPNYGILDKTNLIWNFDVLIKRAQYEKMEEVIIVEGFKAALYLMNNGYPNVVALLGSHLSDVQATLLAKIQTNYCVMLDNDKAGEIGTEKLIYKLYKVCPLFLIQYTSKQPDDLSPDILKNVIANKKRISLKTYQEIANKEEKDKKHVRPNKNSSTHFYDNWNTTTSD